MNRTELNRMKKAELLKLARSKKLKVTSDMRKAEIVDLLAKPQSGATRSESGARTKAKVKTAHRATPPSGFEIKETDNERSTKKDRAPRIAPQSR